MTLWNKARFAFTDDSRRSQLIHVLGSKLGQDIKFVSKHGVTSYFLPNGDVLNCTTVKTSLCREFGTARDWKQRDMGDVSPRIGTSMIEMSVMRMDWECVYLKSEDFHVTVMYVDSPMRVVILVVESKKPIEVEYLSKKWISIPDDIDMMSYFNRRIALAGASSSGKTETARTLTANINIEHGGNAEHATEYVRSFILRYGVPPWQLQPFIEEGQGRRERDISGHTVVISDSPRFLNTIYTRHYFDGQLNAQNIYILHKIYKKSIQALTEYTDIIYCERQKIKEDGCRFQSEDDNAILNAQIYSLLKDHNVKFIEHDVKKDSLQNLTKKIFFLN